MEVPGPEVLLCDTSFIAHYALAARKPARYSHWSTSTLDRIGAAHLAVAPFTVAEIRAGYIIGGWGAARIADSENRLASYVLIPLDEATLEEYAKLHAHCRMTGLTIGQNDLWIAATAISRDLPLVTCDEAQASIPDVAVIYLPPSA